VVAVFLVLSKAIARHHTDPLGLARGGSPSTAFDLVVRCGLGARGPPVSRAGRWPLIDQSSTRAHVSCTMSVLPNRPAHAPGDTAIKSKWS
jgi:hypothetical protein